MAKRNRVETPEKQAKWIKEGRGSGYGENYKPWLTIHDVPSKGGRSRIAGTKIKREHHLLSNLERDYFLILEYRDSVVDIREQFPLFELTETLAIAKECGIEPPTDPVSNYPIVMSSDFRITIKDENGTVDVIRTVKPKGELMDERIIQKFEIERRYWKSKGLDWGIVTELEINQVLARNLNDLRSCHDLSNLDGLRSISVKNRNALISAFKQTVSGNRVVIRDMAHDFDSRMTLEIGTSLSIFKHLLYTKQINMDIDTVKLKFDTPQKISVGKSADIEVFAG
ncbi:TnsA endonuclease N-terminal domain-containing protein [Desulfosporosinus sp. Sb-LF]|uniref:TnsA endonuclease N-terminal domain-containing protein n=1 Tax=Desulfosporosinus sp. Sb-LF TaxID=2560027 RepID=UPI00107F7B4F|nr:TnsA endonuclease N-terminal domain-containing protein [Desulfosporosinus sp. Sb-LF]TGE32996.1 heteromeric transposase endonuclease subunit TnsA [Desulfosporosinus sp. Sb-LF]